MKKILSMVLAMSIVFGTVEPYAAAAADSSAVSAKMDYQAGDTFIDGDLEYTVLEEGTLEVGAASESIAELKEVNIPAQVNGMTVTSIGEYAFYDCTSLASVTIPEGVTSIGGSAFYSCTSLTTVTIPDSVTSIGESAFGRCISLTTVTIPEGVTSIERIVFYECLSLTTVTIPDSVTSIESDAFYGCTSLTTVIIPNSVISIENRAFSGCISLTTVTIPDSVTGIGLYAFYGCTSLTSINVDPKNEYYCSLGGVLFNKDKTTLIQYPAGKTAKSYALPDSVASIRWHAFSGCTSLESVTIPDSVTGIGGFAFDECEKLKDVYYSGSEEEWGKINIDETNEPLTAATIHYNSTDPALSSVQIDIAKPTSGNIPDTSDIKAEVANGVEKPQTITIDADGKLDLSSIADGKLDLSSIADGKYSFTFSANNCAPRAYDVTVAGSTITGLEDGVELHLYGDIDGDGKVNMKDVGKANAHAKNTAKLSGYDLSVSDINGDGKINMQDVGLMNAHAKGSKNLWQ